MAFKQKLTTADTITLPIGDKTYTIEAVDADFGLFLTELTSAGMATKSGAEPSQEQIAHLKDLTSRMNLNGEEGLRRTLGDAYDQMRADSVSFNLIQLAAGTVVTWTVADKDAAEAYWNSGGHVPKGKRPQDRRASKASASTTRKPASTTRTKG